MSTSSFTLLPLPEATFTDAQREAIENLTQGLCVIAAAGSGKTLVLVQRYLRLLRSGYTADQILTVTFTREAAEQLRRRLLTELDGQGAQQEAIRSAPQIGTIHSFCLHLLRTYSPDGFAPREILDDVRWHECFETVFSEWFQNLSPDTLREGLTWWNIQDMETICKEALKGSMDVRWLWHPPSENADTALEPQSPESWWRGTFPLLKQIWRQSVLSQGIYSFSDLEAEALQLLRRDPATRERIQKSLKAFLIDEFQDTSPSQWEILEHLVGEQWHRVFVVGDPRQSIYGFRNADVRIFFAAQDRIATLGGNPSEVLKANGGGKTIQLSTCFRSTPAVVEAINAWTQTLFGGSAFAAEKVLSGRTENSAGLTFLQYACPEKQSAPLSQAEVENTVRYLKKRIESGASAGNFALLFRNSDRISDFALALEAAGIDVQHRKAERLFDAYFSWDLLQFFKAVAQPTQPYVLSAFLLGPFVRASWEQILRWKSDNKRSLLEAALATQPSIKWFHQLLEKGETHPARLLEALFANSRYWPSRFPGWESICKLVSESRCVWEAIQKLEICARNGVLASGGTSESPANPGTGRVSLLTIHAAKGLEFDEVLLVDLLRKGAHGHPWMLLDARREQIGFRYREQGEIASTSTYSELQTERMAREKDEEKRLLYVALTRARYQITVSLPEDPSVIKKDSWAAWFSDKDSQEK